MQKIYIAAIVTGDQYDNSTHNIFATEDKQRVEKWIERYNKIINDNKKRINDFDIESESPTPFMYDEIQYNDPIAIMREVELRK